MYLRETKQEYIVSKQLVKSGTSIGANIREAVNAESPLDFIHKLGLAQKEADETIYWLELLYHAELLTETQFNSVYEQAEELLKMIRSSILTKKKNLNKKSDNK